VSHDVIAAMRSASLGAVLSQPDVRDDGSRKDAAICAVLSAPDVALGCGRGEHGGAAAAEQTDAVRNQITQASAPISPFLDTPCDSGSATSPSRSWLPAS
jgi:hypothetical protein